MFMHIQSRKLIQKQDTSEVFFSFLDFSLYSVKKKKEWEETLFFSFVTPPKKLYIYFSRYLKGVTKRVIRKSRIFPLKIIYHLVSHFLGSKNCGDYSVYINYRNNRKADLCLV